MPVDLQGETMRPRPFTLKGRHVLVMIVAFFAVVSGVNGVMMALAIQTMPGLEVKNSYDASQKFNAEIAEARVVNSHGLKANLGVEAQDPVIHIYDAAGQPAAGLAVSAALIHPTDAGRDEALTFIETGPGSYRPVSALPAGAWRIDVTAKRGADTVFRTDERIMIEAR